MILRLLLLFLIFITQTVAGQTVVPFYDYDIKRWGTKDTVKEKVILPPRFDNITPLSRHIYEGPEVAFPEIFFAERSGIMEVYNQEGEVLACCFSEVWKEQNGTYNYLFGFRTSLDQSLTVSVHPVYNSEPEKPYLELTDGNSKLLYEQGGDLRLVRFSDRQTGSVGLRKQGSGVVLTASYDDIDYVSHSIFSDHRDCCWYRSYHDGKFGLINPKGEEKLPPIYDYVEYYFSQKGYGLIVKDGKSGLIDDAGKIVKELSEDTIVLAYVTFERKNGKQFLLFVRDGQWKLVDGNLKPVLPERYDTIYYEELGNEGFWHFSRSGLWGLAKWDGKMVFLPGYTEVEVLDEQTFLVKRDGKYGYVDHGNKELIPIAYDWLSEQFTGNPPRVRQVVGKKGEEFFLLDGDGNILKQLD